MPTLPLLCFVLPADKTLDLSSNSLSALSRFSHLQHLTITYGVHLDPRSLSHLLHLTHLELSDIDLAKTDPQDDSKPLGSAAMLDAVACLQELQVLQLSPGLLPTPHAPVERYSALTASSHLTFLSLYHCQLPAGAAAAMFPCGRLLAGLRALRMPQPPAGQRPCSAEILNGRSPFLSGQAASILRAARDNSGASSSSAMRSGGVPFGPGSIASLASCCPNLQQLWLTAAIAADVDLTPVQHLTGLTELQLGGPVVDDAVSEGLLCGLTQLQRLDLLQCPRFTDAGLVFLTALRQLTSLQVKDAGLSYCAAGDGVGHMLYMVRRQEVSGCRRPQGGGRSAERHACCLCCMICICAFKGLLWFSGCTPKCVWLPESSAVHVIGGCMACAQGCKACIGSLPGSVAGC